MKSNKKDKLFYAVICSAILVSAALVFAGIRFGGQMDSDDLQAEIFDGIDAYIENLNEQAQEEAAAAQAQAAQVEGDFADDDAMIGDPSAPVTIVEFTDFQCPYCARHTSETYPQIYENYIATGKVRYIFRDFPLSFHEPYSSVEAMATECAREQVGDEKYVEYHDLLFENMGTIVDDTELIYSLAAEVGANSDSVKTCVESGKYSEEIAADRDAGSSAGISGTPAFLVNGYFVSGAQPFEVFAEIIDTKLAELGY